MAKILLFSWWRAIAYFCWTVALTSGMLLQGRAIVTRSGGIVVSAELSKPPQVFLQCRVRSGCDGVTCWDRVCPCHCLPMMEWLANGAVVSTVPAAFLCTDFWRLPGTRAPHFHGRLMEGAAPGCYLHHAGSELLIGWGWAWMDPSLSPSTGSGRYGSFRWGGFWSDCQAEPLCPPGGFGGSFLQKKPRQTLCVWDQTMLFLLWPLLQRGREPQELLLGTE